MEPFFEKGSEWEKFLGGGGKGNTFFKKGFPYGEKVFGKSENLFSKKGFRKKNFWEGVVLVVEFKFIWVDAEFFEFML
ncbi:MAG: hypothetical protein D6805_07660 [Planctomycetota bacterium]|nr:MAG: hypothetical protein D6805_07660 [Planctomycetota bacterium]